MGSVHCESDATIDFTNSGDKDGAYWMIVADVDCSWFALRFP